MTTGCKCFDVYITQYSKSNESTRAKEEMFFFLTVHSKDVGH